MIVPIKFESKEQYLQWRSVWRKEYASLSAVIRDTRVALKLYQRTGKLDYAWTCQRQLLADSRLASQYMVRLEGAKASVRQRLRELGFEAPDPKVREKPALRPKHKWTAEEIADARHGRKHESRHVLGIEPVAHEHAPYAP